MTRSLTGTRTEKNLAATFAGELMARNRYPFIAGAAKKQGREAIAAIFIETADNEKERAKTFLKAASAKITIPVEIPRLPGKASQGRCSSGIPWFRGNAGTVDTSTMRRRRL
jgi:hypothetical protein